MANDKWTKRNGYLSLAGIKYWRSVWDIAGIRYVAGDGVHNAADGSAYICILEHTSDADSRPGVGVDWELYWDLLVAGSNSTIPVTQTAHGFSIGNYVKMSAVAGVYELAQADSLANAQGIGFVTSIDGVNGFTLTQNGYVENSSVVPAQPAGTVMYLDSVTAGDLTNVRPTANNSILKPVAVIVQSGVSMWILSDSPTVVKVGGGTGGVESVTSSDDILNFNNTDPDNPVGSIDVVELANDTTFVDSLVDNNYFTTELANNTNFVNELTTNTTFQSAVNNFVTIGGGGGSSGKPMSFYAKIGISSGSSTNGYHDTEAVFSVNSTSFYLADPTGDSQERDYQTDWAGAEFVKGHVLLNGYLYVLLTRTSATAESRVYRYDAEDLSLGGTLISFSGATLGTHANMTMTSDGVRFFFTFDAGNSADAFDIAKFTISGTTLTYLSTTTCTTTTPGFSGALAVDTNGSYIGTKDGSVSTIFICDSTGTQTSTQSESFTIVDLLNWTNTIYGFISTDKQYSKLYLPDTQSSTSYGGTSIRSTANEDLTAGQTVGIGNISGGIARAIRYSDSVELGYTLHNNNLYTNNQTEIGGEKFVVLGYQSSNDSLYASVGTIDRDTLSLSFGTAVAATADIDNPLRCVCKLDTDKFIVFYKEDASASITKYRVGTVSGDVITFGSAATFYDNADVITGIRCAQIGTDKGVVFIAGNTITATRVLAFTVSGTTATIGTAVTPGSNVRTESAIQKVDTDKFMIASSQGYAQVGTISGTTITLGTEVQYTISSVASDGKLEIVSTVTDVAVIRFSVSATETLIACTISGTVPTFGTQVSGSTTTYGLIATDPNTLLTVSNGKIFKYTLAGTVLTFNNSVMYQAGTLEVIINMANGYFIAMNGTTTGVNILIEGMSNGFIGIVQDTASRGSVVDVLTNGVDSNQVDLVPGTYYEPINGGLSSIPSSDTAYTSKLIAISDTEVSI